LLRPHFPDRLIYLRGRHGLSHLSHLQWPPRSPNLAPCDFFLWGYLKSLVYVDRPRTLAHLKNNIRDAIANIPIDMLQRVDTNLKITDFINVCAMGIAIYPMSFSRLYGKKLGKLYSQMKRNVKQSLKYFCFY
jgi:hypothetical protein